MSPTIFQMNQGVKDRYFLPLLLLFLTDFVVLSFSFVAAFFVRFHTGIAVLVPPSSDIIPSLVPYIQLSMVIAVLGVVVYDRFGFYDYRIGLDRKVRASSLIIATAVVYIFMMAFLFNYSGGYSRPTVALAVPLSCFAIVFIQHFLRKVQFFLVKNGIVFIKSVLIGPESRCLDALQRIQEFHGSEYQILGFLSTEPMTEESREKKQIPALGQLSDLAPILHRKALDNVIIALSPRECHLVPEIIKTCQEYKVNYNVVPDIYDEVSRVVGVNEVEGLPTLHLGETPLHGFGLMMKRAMDCIIAGTALILASPVILFVSLLIKLDSQGPVFFVQERVGNDGRKFKIYKFRSMIDQAEKDTGPKWATANDPRTTRVGRFIRMYNLDELPQFVNVLKGDMSLVGPRPERPYFVDKFKEQIPHYMRRHMVKTGITGWAQVNGLRGDTSVVKRTKYDLYYVKNWSIFFDLKILLKTLFSFKNAY